MHAAYSSNTQYRHTGDTGLLQWVTIAFSKFLVAYYKFKPMILVIYKECTKAFPEKTTHTNEPVTPILYSDLFL